MDLTLSGDLWIGGLWLQGQGPLIESEQPVSGEVVWRGDAAGIDDVDAAIRAARKAFPPWRQRPLAERQAIIEAFGRQLEQHKEDLARLIGQETGKPLWESRTEVAAMIGKIGISVQAYQERTGHSEADNPAGRAVLRHRPHGCLLYTSPSPRDRQKSRMPSSA